MCLFASVLSVYVYIVYFVGLYQHDVVDNTHIISFVSQVNKYESIIKSTESIKQPYLTEHKQGGKTQ